MEQEHSGLYRCQQCDEVWDFIPEDYASPEDWPDKCPLCTMPLSQMIKDVYEADGLLAVIKQLYLRYKF